MSSIHHVNACILALMMFDRNRPFQAAFQVLIS